MFRVKRFCCNFLLPILLASGLSASIYAEESAVYQWQKKRLLNPSEITVQKEKQAQKVFIYEGLKLEDVEKALDQHFDRVEHMMFVGTLLPPTSAGIRQKEQDGCD